ncbi:MAG: hypothetical protein JRH20_12470 [Deltaproteobacteria bacterium]|nr:hypothetical protein [Deltaproteobacteria bacterium]
MKTPTKLTLLCLLFSSLLVTHAHADLVKVRSHATVHGVKVANHVTLNGLRQLSTHSTPTLEKRARKLDNALRAMTSALEQGTGPDYVEFRRIVGATKVGGKLLNQKHVPGTSRKVSQVYRATARYGLADVIEIAKSQKLGDDRGISAKTLAKEAKHLLPPVDAFLRNLNAAHLLKSEKALLKEAKKARSEIAARAKKARK